MQRTYEYGVGRGIAPGERELIKYLDDQFAKERYALPALMRTIATSGAFQAVAADTVASN